MKIIVGDEQTIEAPEVRVGITRQGVLVIRECNRGLEITFDGELIFAKLQKRTAEGFQCTQCGAPLGIEYAGYARCSSCRVTG